MQEIWRDVEGYEGLYQVSNLRRVKSLNYKLTGKEEIRKQQKNNRGYLYIQLHKDGERKDYLVHRLVAIAFIPNPENYTEVNHMDEDKTNNAVGNLEWCSPKYNVNYGTRNERDGKSKGKQVMCVETGVIYSSTIEAGKQTKINSSHIRECAAHRKYFHTARRYHWEYI